jgi:hypothetical protein
VCEASGEFGFEIQDTRFKGIQDSGFMSASGWFFGMPLETKIIYFVTSTFAGLA